jgi:hypothetical protein
MNKKILMATVVVAIMAISGWNISQNKSKMALSDVALANVEALADGEVIGCVCQNVYIAICKPGIAGFFVGDIVIR